MLVHRCSFVRSAAFTPKNVLLHSSYFSRTINPSVVVALRDSSSGSSSSGNNILVDDQGRRIRTRGGDKQQKNDGGDQWSDDYDARDYRYKDNNQASSSSGRFSPRRSSSFERSDSREYGQQRQQRDQFQPRGRGGRDRYSYYQQQDSYESLQQRKTNMNALEGAGFVHLYGLAPVLNALKANRRDFSRPDNNDSNEFSSGTTSSSFAEESSSVARKPEAQFSPWLFVQEQKSHIKRGRSSDKAWQEQEILKLAKERNLPVASVDKGVLNTLSGNRPHQGVCLRCGKLDFNPLSRIPFPGGGGDDHDDEIKETPNFWLILDEVVDPQNLGALLRSVYFLGGATRVGVLVCAKNSAPPSPIVSAASAGALELLNIYSTSNLPRTLAAAEQDGFTILGASSDIKDLLDTPVYDLHKLPTSLFDSAKPTLLVLGSEGSGLRHLVAKSCTAFVRIPGASEDTTDSVDSLNVSVTGGILLWTLLSSRLN